MKLFLGDIALHTLARHLQITGQTGVFEPADLPQRERRTVRVRLEFREDSHHANASLVEQVRTALQTPLTQLKWQDDSGPDYINRWVTITESEQGEDSAWGTTLQALTFSFYYYIHTLTTNCVPATLKRQPDGPALDLGAVLKWRETLDMDRFHEQRDPRRRVMCNLEIGGRFQGDTAATLTDCRTALLARKDALVAQVTQGAAFELEYGTFKKTVRLNRFTADVDQPSHCIEWQMQAAFTKTPDEADYAWLEWDLGSRETKSEGIISLTLRGRVGASSAARARTALEALCSGAGSLIPAGYVMLRDDVTEHQVRSGDGTAFTELLFDREWRDTTGLPITVKKSGASETFDLHVVERFSDRYLGELADPLRSHRRRAGGAVTLTGKIFAADDLTQDARQTLLVDRKKALDAVLNGNPSIELSYGAAGSVFLKTVRVQDWDCQLNRVRQCLEWSLSATYTRFPNEADYAICDFRTGTRENNVEGTVLFLLSGRIAAPTIEAANERLARLRTAVVPAGYTRLSADPVAERFSIESDRAGGTDKGDGETFIALTFNDEYQKTTGDVLTWSLRVSDTDDVKTGFVTTGYSGSVQARGASRDAAWITALTKAEELGRNKYPFLLRSVVTENTRLFQTTDAVAYVTVEFNYEYQRKGPRTYIEVAAERSRDTFGQTIETVSGYVAAPDLATASAAYLADVRNTASYAGKLLVNERTPTLSRQVIRGVAGADQFDRYAFSFSVFVDKTAGETAVEYEQRSQPNYQTLEQTTTVSGRVFAVDEAAATAFLETFLASLNLGARVGQSVRTVSKKQGPKVSGSGTVTAFYGLEFSENFMSRLTGVDGILECEVTEQLRYSGNRLVEKPIPGGISLFQNTGTTSGQRIVTGRVRATTPTACLTWAKKCRGLLLTAEALYEEAPTITTSHRFLPRTDGTVSGPDADVLVYECQFQFQEWLPELALV